LLYLYCCCIYVVFSVWYCRVECLSYIIVVFVVCARFELQHVLFNLHFNKYLPNLYFPLLIIIIIIIIIVNLLCYVSSNKNIWAYYVRNFDIYINKIYNMLNFLGPYLNLDTTFCLYFNIEFSVLLFTSPSCLPSSKWRVKKILNNIRCSVFVCAHCYKEIMLYYSCYIFNLCVDWFGLQHSVECALYHVVFKKKVITLTISCYVCSSERNKVVECKTCETV
jgi:hypothetical protein